MLFLEKLWKMWENIEIQRYRDRDRDIEKDMYSHNRKKKEFISNKTKLS